MLLCNQSAVAFFTLWFISAKMHSSSRRFLLSYVCLVMMLSVSCIKRTYRVQVENRTKYDLTKLIVRMHSADTISLQPYETSEVLSLTYTTRFPLNLLGEGGLSVYPAEYRYLDSVYTNTRGIYWTKSKVSRREVVRIVITECTGDDATRCTGAFFVKPESGISLNYK